MTYHKVENRNEIDAYIKKHYHKVEAATIGIALGISKRAVRMRAWRLGLSHKKDAPKKPVLKITKTIATGYLVVKGNVTRHIAY